MRIAMFTDAYWPRVNGVTVSVDSFSRSLIKEGHQVLIVCSHYPENLNTTASLFDAPEEEGPRIVRVPSMPARVTREDRLAKFGKWYWVFNQVKDFNPDIIHVNSEVMIAVFGFFYAGANNLPAIYTFHTMWEDYGPNYFPLFPVFLVKFLIRRWLKRILGSSYRVIVPTPQIAEVVHSYKAGLKTFLLPTGIEGELFDHDEEEGAAFRKKLEERYPRLKGKRILMFAGRVAKEKNLGLLVDILPKILARCPEVVLLIAGNGPDLEFYRERARRAGLEENCVFTGYVDRRDLALIYTISEIFLFPSLTDTQGLVTLESMFSGTPVVAVGVLGTLMVMGGDNGGFMVKNDEAEFAARVLELLEDPELRRRKSLEAREHARAWSMEELAKKLVAFYESTIQEYREEYGEPRSPVWKNLTDKRWWKINNKIFQKKASRKWQEMLSRLSGQFGD